MVWTVAGEGPELAQASPTTDSAPPSASSQILCLAQAIS